ncbi:MAG TPA: FKBP-type peptidyl-prolyl cis-trans isomerase [Thermoanaerobaculia bacterium]|nr:FKBP-type peptidyl-prolyl cis-trans isomerase [Thermoanaerobaculia bacterium]
MRRFLIASALTLSVTLPAAAQDAKPAAPKAPAKTSQAAGAPSTEKDKTLYALGLVISRNLAAFALTPAELTIVQGGLADGVLGKTPKVDIETYGPKLQDLAKARMTAAAATEKKAGAAFLEKAAAEPGAKKEPSGFVYRETKAGTGASPKATDRVKVHYRGTLVDGSVFDSSIDRGEPVTFPLSGVIPCWTQGLQLMKEGGSARLVCPSDLAYGDGGRPPHIKGGATLVFDVQLLSIEKDAPKPPEAKK